MPSLPNRECQKQTRECKYLADLINMKEITLKGRGRELYNFPSIVLTQLVTSKRKVINSQHWHLEIPSKLIPLFTPHERETVV